MAAADLDRTALPRADGGLAVKLRRMEIGEISLLVQKFGAKNQIPLLDRLWQAEARLERSFTRAQRELERLQKSRSKQPSQPTEAAPPEIRHLKSDIPPCGISPLDRPDLI